MKLRNNLKQIVISGALVIASLFMFACSTSSTAMNESANNAHNVSATNSKTSGEIVGTNWYLSNIAGHDKYKLAYKEFTLVFHKENLSGKAFNNFTSPYKVGQNGTLFVSDKMVSTKKAIANKELVALENDYMNQVMAARQWKLKGDVLILTGDKGSLEFIRGK